MRKTLLIIGIIAIILGVLLLLVGAFYGYASMHTLDGSASQFQMQRRLMFIFLTAGVICTVIGIVCLILRGKVIL